jgi:hypothetical protein
VLAHALLRPELDGRALEITGPKENSLSANDMRKCINSFLLEVNSGASSSNMIEYQEIPLPENTDMKELWEYLRAGGFDSVTDVVNEITGRTPILFSTLFPLLLSSYSSEK